MAAESIPLDHLKGAGDTMRYRDKLLRALFAQHAAQDAMHEVEREACENIKRHALLSLCSHRFVAHNAASVCVTQYDSTVKSCVCVSTSACAAHFNCYQSQGVQHWNTGICRWQGCRRIQVALAKLRKELQFRILK